MLKQELNLKAPLLRYIQTDKATDGGGIAFNANFDLHNFVKKLVVGGYNKETTVFLDYNFLLYCSTGGAVKGETVLDYNYKCMWNYKYEF